MVWGPCGFCLNRRSHARRRPAGRILASQTNSSGHFTNLSNCMARLVVLCFMNLPYLWGITYEKPHCTINVLYVVFCAFVMNCENQELIWFKFHNCNNISNSEGNGIVDGKPVGPVRLCIVCFSPATGERLPTPVVEKSVAVRGPWYLTQQRNIK